MNYDNRKYIMIPVVALLNIALIACVICSAFCAFNNAEKVIFSYDAENVGTLTDLSASNNYNGIGMTEAETFAYFEQCCVFRDFSVLLVFLVMLFIADIIFIVTANRNLKIKSMEVEKANKSKSVFLSSMSHDIRTPMNEIIGMTLMVDKELDEENIDRDAMRNCIESIEHSENHMMALINDILDISNIENGEIILDISNFSISDAVCNVIGIFDTQIKEKSLSLETHMKNVAHEYVTGDLQRVNQIFINILANAVKYTESGGKITVDLTEEALPYQPKKSRYVYRVTDTGIGMSAEFVETIFDCFTRAVDTRINAVRGAGLGMAIVRNLVDIMGGTVEVESELNIGSAVTVTLDFSVVKSVIVEKETETFPDMNVLIAEDNDINWKIISGILKYHSIKSERAANGQIAVDMINRREQPYDLIFMDIQMPVMNGYSATELIRKLEDRAKALTPVYALTADAFEEDIKKCRRTGMNGHLSKPVDIGRLLEIIRTVSGKTELL